mgnify:CR=1 FL=1
MPLATGAIMTFTGYLIVDDPLGIEMQFVCANPGGEQPSDYTVIITDSEWAAATNNAQRLNLIRNKLLRKYRASGLATTLDAHIGASFTI